MAGLRRLIFLPAVFFLVLGGCSGAGKTAFNNPLEEKAAELDLKGEDAYRAGDYALALERFTEALRVKRSIDGQQGEISGLINSGRTLLAMEEYEKSAVLLRQAAGLAAGLEDHENLSEAYATLAKAEFLSGDTGAAKGHIEESLQIDLKMGYKSGSRLNVAAAVYIESGDYARAGAALTRAMKLNGASGGEAANTLRLFGDLELKEGRPKAAAEFYSKAYEADRLAGSPFKTALDLEKMAFAEAAGGRLEDAAALFERSGRIYLNGGMKARALETLDRIIEIYGNIGDMDRAAYYIKAKEGFAAGTDAQKGMER